MTASQKYEIALQFQAEGNEAVYQAIVNSLSADEVLELLLS